MNPVDKLKSLASTKNIQSGSGIEKDVDKEHIPLDEDYNEEEDSNTNSENIQDEYSEDYIFDVDNIPEDAALRGIINDIDSSVDESSLIKVGRYVDVIDSESSSLPKSIDTRNKTTETSVDKGTAKETLTRAISYDQQDEEMGKAIYTEVSGYLRTLGYSLESMSVPDQQKVIEMYLEEQYKYLSTVAETARKGKTAEGFAEPTAKSSLDMISEAIGVKSAGTAVFRYNNGDTATAWLAQVIGPDIILNPVAEVAALIPYIGRVARVFVGMNPILGWAMTSMTTGRSADLNVHETAGVKFKDMEYLKYDRQYREAVIMGIKHVLYAYEGLGKSTNKLPSGEMEDSIAGVRRKFYPKQYASIEHAIKAYEKKMGGPAVRPLDYILIDKSKGKTSDNMAYISTPYDELLDEIANIMYRIVASDLNKYTLVSSDNMIVTGYETQLIAVLVAIWYLAPANLSTFCASDKLAIASCIGTGNKEHVEQTVAKLIDAHEKYLNSISSRYPIQVQKAWKERISKLRDIHTDICSRDDYIKLDGGKA